MAKKDDKASKTPSTDKSKSDKPADAKEAKAEAKKADKDDKDDKADAKKDDKKSDAKKDDAKKEATKAEAKKDAPKDKTPENAPASSDPQSSVGPELDLGDADDGEPEREPLVAPEAVDVDADPNIKAAPPKRAPRGDARSLRRNNDFCLIYRHERYLVRREGTVGLLGQWSVTEYPSTSAAAHAYAQECSDLTGAGFSDLRG